MAWIGLASATFGAIFAAIGDCLVKIAFLNENGFKLPAGEFFMTFRSGPLWVVGMGLSGCLDGILTLVALQFIPAATVAALGGLRIALTTITARMLIGEQLMLQHSSGVIFILIGLLINIPMAHRFSKTLDFETLISTIQSSSFLGSFCFVTFVLMLAVLVSLIPSRTMDFVEGPSVTTIPQRSSNPTAESELSRFRKVLQYITNTSVPTALRIVSTALASGISGAIALVGCEILVKVGLSEGVSVAAEPAVVLIGFGVVLSMCSQIYFLNRGLDYFEPVAIIPGANCVLISCSLLLDSILFAAQEVPSHQKVLVFLGVCILCGGIVLVSYGDALREVEQLQALERELTLTEERTARDVIGMKSPEGSNLKDSTDQYFNELDRRHGLNKWRGAATSSRNKTRTVRYSPLSQAPEPLNLTIESQPQNRRDSTDPEEQAPG